MNKPLTTLAIATALAFPAAAGATLPVHPGHPILPPSSIEAQRNLPKVPHYKIAKPAPPLKQEFRTWIRR